MRYRSRDFDNTNKSIRKLYRVSISYITGSHSLKAGFNDGPSSSSMYTYLVGPPLTYRFNNGVPNQFTQYALPSIADGNTDHDLGLFVQDKWTPGRLTLSGGLRFDYFADQLPRDASRAHAVRAPARHHDAEDPGRGLEGHQSPNRDWPTTSSAPARPR